MPPLLLWLLHADLWAALAVTSLVFFGGEASGAPASAALLGLAFSGTVLIYNLDHYRDELESPGPRRVSRVARRRLLVTSALGLVGCTAVQPWPVPAVVALPGLVGIAYHRLKHVGGGKSWLVAGSVAFASVALPLAAAGRRPSSPSVSLFGILVVLVAVNAHSFDLIDVERDRGAAVRTLPVARGSDATRRMLTWLVTATVLATGVLFSLQAAPLRPELPLVLGWSLLWARRARPGVDRDRWRLMLDGTLMLPALVALLMRGLG